MNSLTELLNNMAVVKELNATISDATEERKIYIQKTRKNLVALARERAKEIGSDVLVFKDEHRVCINDTRYIDKQCICGVKVTDSDVFIETWSASRHNHPYNLVGVAFLPVDTSLGLVDAYIEGVMSAYARPFAAFVVCFNEKGHVAVSTRDDGSVGLPGGKLDHLETPMACARRETAEEGWAPAGLGNFFTKCVHRDVVDGQPVEWFLGKTLRPIVGNYKEKARGIKPVWLPLEVFLERCPKSFKNDWLRQYLPVPPIDFSI